MPAWAPFIPKRGREEWGGASCKQRRDAQQSVCVCIRYFLKCKQNIRDGSKGRCMSNQIRFIRVFITLLKG